MSRSSVPVLRAQLVLAVLVMGVVTLLALPATAADTRVAVQDKGEDGGQYKPAAVTVFEGDEVLWVWEGDNHSVTFHDPSIPSSECTVFVVIECSNTGDSHRVTFKEAGKYDYFCRVHGAAMSGSVTVEPAPEPTESEPSETEPTDPESTPTVPAPTDPTPTESEPTESEPTDPGPTDREPTDPESTDPAPTDPAPTDPEPTEPEPTATATPTPTDAATEPSEAPTATRTPIDVPDPTFEPFPAPGDTSSPEEVAGGVSITPPDDGSGSRTLWGVVGGLTVLGTIGAIGRSVLFAEPWDTL